MKPTIKIDFVSHITWPWCAVGLGNLNRIISQLGEKANCEIHVHSFEPNPNMPLEGQDAIEHLTKKFLDIAVDLPSVGDFAKSRVA